ncbi:MAG: YgaP family membrane protein [Verrucomicrobiales bacterium]
MGKWFQPNINSTGRILRAIYGVLLCAAAFYVQRYSVWAAIICVLAGGFALFEAARGWCIMRACGVKTKW